MLLTRRSPPRALFVPVFGIVLGTGATALFVSQAATMPSLRNALFPLIGAVLFGAITWMFVDDVAAVRADGAELRLRGWRRRRAVSLLRSRIAVDYQPGSRTPRFSLAITDGDATVELGEWTSEKRAERAAATLEALFGLDDGSAARRKGDVAVMRIERRWREQVDETQQVIDAYYESALWRRVKYGGLLAVVAYAAGMIIYIRFWGS